jgi:Phosphoglycerol transferase and related proteins, alkaline phosphatase superfamily
MINRLLNNRKFAGKRRLHLLPFFCFTLVLAAKTLLFTGTVGLTSPAKQLLTQALGTGGALMIILALSLLLAPRFRLFYLIIIDVILSVIILFDLIFFRYFQDVMTIRTFVVAWHYLNSETVWWKMLRLTDFLLAADFLLLLGWVLCRRRAQKPKSSKLNSKTNSPKGLKTFELNWAAKLFVFVLIVLAGTGCCIKAYYILEADQPGITRSFYAKTYITQSIGVWEFRMLDISRTLKTRLPGEEKRLVQSEKKAALANWLRTEHPRSYKADSAVKVQEGTNLIVIQLESFQEFVIGRSINGQEITPNLNRLIEKSLYFKNYFGETWNGGTSDAEFMSNVSLYPVSVGNAYIDYPGNNYVSLGKVLGEKGYYTVAMEADQPGFWGMGLMFRSEGFQHILDMNGFVHDLDIGMGLADNSMFQQGADYLEKIPQPFYSFQVTLSSHYPFLIPDKFKTINVEPYQDKDFGHYLESVHYTDQALGCFLDRLQAAGLLDKSVLAIYGDHQAPFTRDNSELRKFLGYGEGEMDDYQWLALQKVPMLIYLPQEIKTGVIETVAGHVDLFPTILGLMGEDAARYPLFGHDLLNSSAEGLAINRCGMLVTDNVLLDINNQKAYEFKSGKPLPWEDFKEEQNMYQEYLQNTDSIMKHDLQQSLLGLLSSD